MSDDDEEPFLDFEGEDEADEDEPYDHSLPPYQQHSETSRQAAEEIKPDTATLRGMVLAYIRKCGEKGATDDEVQEKLHMNGSTQRPRRVELWRRNLVRRTAVKRLTRSGRWAVVWVAEVQPEALQAGSGVAVPGLAADPG